MLCIPDAGVAGTVLRNNTDLENRGETMSVTSGPTPENSGKPGGLMACVLIAGLSRLVAFAVTPLIHLWLQHFNLSVTWQAAVVGPYGLVIVALLAWQAVRQPKRRYKALVTLLALGLGVAAGVWLIRNFNGDVFTLLSICVGILVVVAASMLCSVFRH